MKTSIKLWIMPLIVNVKISVGMNEERKVVMKSEILFNKYELHWLL